MADNVNYTEGSGIAIASDDVSGVHYQRVKLTDGAADSTAAIGGDATNGLDVDVTRVQGTVAVTATDLDIRALAAATDAVTAMAGSVVDTNNSTTTPLTGGATYTGTGTDCLNYASIAVTLTADQASTAGGMKFQFSTDNTNWDDSYAFDFVAATCRRFQFPVCARYFRVQFVNAASAQSYFRVQTILHTTNILTSIHRLDADIKPDRSAQLVKAGLIAQINGSGDFTPIQANAAGVLKIGGSVSIDGTAAVSGPLTDTQLRATPVPVSGTFYQATQPVSIAAAVPVTDNASSLTVDAADLDIRDLTSTDVVTVTGGAGQAADVKVTLDGEAVTGTVTANAGTNLNTSALALETGGNLAASATSLAVLDDWDESDRCKVNPISGQVGVQGGSGTVSTTTQRVVLATDVALPAGSNTLGSLLPNQYELAGTTLHVKKYYTNVGAVTDGIVWSPAAGKRWYVTDIFLNVSAAATVTLEDDLTAGDSVVWKAELAANSGWSHSFTTPLFSGEDAADLLITTSAGTVYVMVTGYEV